MVEFAWRLGRKVDFKWECSCFGFVCIISNCCGVGICERFREGRGLSIREDRRDVDQDVR